MSSPLEQARTSLNKALSDRKAISSQAHSLDSIACSLLHIAENINTKPATVSDDQIELVVRRLLDDTDKPNPKKQGSKK